MNITIPKDAKCPYCGAPNDAATEVYGTDAQPQDGDVCICATCGLIAMYAVADEALTVRFATEQELAELEKMPSMAAAFALSERISGER